ncbi:hypothetical protein AB0N73_02465 [Microbacterium sp. NPDC089189]|uniref:hypothetical protein n=1 Tax=Microbacterium sp. NPDC089189 TaxID=3154972 RepID=UPI0034375369
MDVTLPVDSAWTPVLRLDESSWLGLVGTSLYVGGLSEPKRELDPAHPIALLPCLERSRRSVVSELTEREAELDRAPGSLVATVPLGLVASMAVLTRLDYWVLRALDWLDDGTPDEAEKLLLDEITHAEWASQQARHRAQHVLRKYAARE